MWRWGMFVALAVMAGALSSSAADTRHIVVGAPAFTQLDGGALITVPLSRDTRFEQFVERGELVIVIPNASLASRNAARALDTRYFATPVAEIKSTQTRRGKVEIAVQYKVDVPPPEVTVTIVPGRGVERTLRVEIGSARQPPIAQPVRAADVRRTLAVTIQSTRAGNEREPLKLQAQPTGDYAEPVRFTWELGGDTVKLGAAVSHRFPPGDHAITLTAIDAAGRVATASTAIHVAHEQPAIAAVRIPSSIDVGSELHVEVDARNPGVGSLIYQFDWDDDGRFEDVRHDPFASHVYMARGRHSVGIRVVDPQGLASETRRRVDILYPEGGDLYVSSGIGSGAFVLVSPYKQLGIQDRVNWGRWAYTADLDVAYLLNRVIALSARQTLAVEGGAHYSVRPGITFFTPRRIFTTYTRVAAAFHFDPWLYGADLAEGLIVKVGRYAGVRIEIGIEPLFGGTVDGPPRDPATPGRYSLLGNGMVLPLTLFTGLVMNVF